MATQTIMRTQRHGVKKARVTVLHDSGNVDVVVAASGDEDPMSDVHIVQALRNTLTLLNAVGAHIEQHVDDYGY